MKVGLTTSVILHAALIAFGLFTLSAPHSLEAADVEALPVDIVPIDSLTQIQQGDKKAPKKETSSPKKTEKTASIDNAQNVGDNEVDLKTPPTPEARPLPVEQTADQPPPQPKPVDKPKLDDVKPVPKPEPAPAVAEAPKPLPKQEVKPDPAKQPVSTATAKEPPKPAPPKEEDVPAEKPQPKDDQVADAIAEAKPADQDLTLPDSAPSPDARPRPPQAETAKAPEHKDTEKPPTEEAAARRQSDSKDDTLDKVAALLNKQKPSGGGAKRSTQEASLGGDKTTGGSKLSQSEMDALRGQIEKCWNVPAGAEDGADLKVSIKFKLDRSGALEGDPEIVSGGGGDGVKRAAAESARRAVLKCSPYNLPAEKYDAWADVVVNFDPSDMF